MRILKFSWFYEYPYGGAEIVARMLRAGLEERGHAVDVVCLAGGPLTQTGRVHRLALPGLAYRFPWVTKVCLIFLFNRAFDAHFLRLTRRLNLPWHEYDFIHCHDLHTLAVALALGLEHGVPVGATLHELYPRFPFWAGGWSPLRRLLWLSLRCRDAYIRNVLRGFGWVAGVSRFITRKAAEYADGAWLDTVYNPVMFPGVAAPATARERSRCRLLFIGRLCREKGIDLLLEAFARLDASYELTILGLHGPLAGQVQMAAARDARIRLLPAVSHDAISAQYFAHDLLCLPSLCEESFGLAVAEARTHGCAIVTTRQGGLPEVVEGYPKAVTIEVRGKKRAAIVSELAEAIARCRPLCSVPLDPAAEEVSFGDMRLGRCLDKYEALYRSPRGQAIPLG